MYFRQKNLFKFTGDISDLGQLYSISLDNFEKDILPNLQEHDSVILFDSETNDAELRSDTSQLHTTVEK